MVFFILPILCIVFEESLFFFVACYMVHSVCCEDVYRIKRAIGYKLL